MCTECEEEVRHRNSCVYHNRDLEDKRHQNSIKNLLSSSSVYEHPL